MKIEKVLNRFDEQMRRMAEAEAELEPYEPEAQEWNPNLSDSIDYIIPFDCVARDIQQWILSSSIYPQPAISFAATMSVLSVAIGRGVAYENIKGNLMYLCMAESGEGKDWPFKAAKKVLDAVGIGNRVHGRMASGAALYESLDSHPSMLFHIDEFGNYLSSINGKNSNQYSKEIVDIMTECYTSADGCVYSKTLKGKEPLKITEPNLCVFGLSTERQVFDGLRTSDLANGSLARYSLLFGLSGMEPRRIKPEARELPITIVERLREYIDSVQPFMIASRQIPVSEKYDDAKFDLSLRLKRFSNELIKNDGNKAAFVPMVNRIAVRCIQQAMMIDLCHSVDVLAWIEKLEMDSVNVFMKKFLHLGADNEDERLANLLHAKIKEAGTKGISAKDLIFKTRQIKTPVRQAMIRDLLDCGIIGERKIDKGTQRFTTVYFWIK